MKNILTFAALAAGALVLTACGGTTEEAPAAEPIAEETVAADPMATETMTPEEEANANLDKYDENGNPIVLGAVPTEAPAR